MGMFDSVIFQCPKCDKRIEEQSKSGECNLTTFPEYKVPIDIAINIINNIIDCSKCKNKFQIIALDMPITIQMKLIKPYDINFYEELEK